MCLPGYKLLYIYITTKVRSDWKRLSFCLRGIPNSRLGQCTNELSPWGDYWDIDWWCIPLGCWRFTISDSKGYGISDGYYNIEYGGELIRTSNFSNAFEESTIFGECTSSPTLAPTVQTEAPSETPVSKDRGVLPIGLVAMLGGIVVLVFFCIYARAKNNQRRNGEHPIEPQGLPLSQNVESARASTGTTATSFPPTVRFGSERSVQPSAPHQDLDQQRLRFNLECQLYTKHVLRRDNKNQRTPQSKPSDRFGSNGKKRTFASQFLNLTIPPSSQSIVVFSEEQSSPPSIQSRMSANDDLEGYQHQNRESDDSESAQELQQQQQQQSSSSRRRSNVIARTIASWGNLNDQQACHICLMEYDVGESVSWSPNPECQHAFHTDCILDWLLRSPDKKCPMCRRNYLLADNSALQEH